MAWCPRIGILGAGALGCFYGAKLARSGLEVHFLMRRDLAAVRENGLRIESAEGGFTVHPPVYAAPGDMGFCDLLIVGLKTTDNAALDDLLAPTAGPQTIVVTMQNGLGNEEEIERVLTKLGHANPRQRIFGATAFLCSRRGEPGIVQHIDHGWIQLAGLAGPACENTQAIAGLFADAGVRCDVLDSLAEARWRKLVWNIPFNGLGAAYGADARAVLADPQLLALARELMEETIAAASGDGVAIEKPFIDFMLGQTASMGPYKSSMQLDRETGRPLETDAILGEPLRRALRAGIAAPRLEALAALLRSGGISAP